MPRVRGIPPSSLAVWAANLKEEGVSGGGGGGGGGGGVWAFLHEIYSSFYCLPLDCRCHSSGLCPKRERERESAWQARGYVHVLHASCAGGGVPRTHTFTPSPHIPAPGGSL